MKKIIVIFLLSIVLLQIYGADIYYPIELKPSESFTMIANPEVPGYSYNWEFEEGTMMLKNFDTQESNNMMTIKSKDGVKRAHINVYCLVTDENGNIINSYYWDIVVQP